MGQRFARRRAEGAQPLDEEANVGISTSNSSTPDQNKEQSKAEWRAVLTLLPYLWPKVFLGNALCDRLTFAGRKDA